MIATMPEKVSATRLKTSYQNLIDSLPEGINPDFSLQEYTGKHEAGEWKRYSFTCKTCGVRFTRVLNRQIVCPSCTNFTRPARQTSWSDLLKRFHQKHGNRYEYPCSKPEPYRGQRTIIDIVCPEHGIFQCKISKHLDGSGCIKCRNESRSVGTNEFIQRAKEIHGTRYDYSHVEYVNQYVKTKIVCTTHGEFQQAPGHHMYSGSGCPQCAIGKQTSRAEKEIASFVKGLGVSIRENVRDIISPFELDIYVPSHNIAIEYCGLRYHSTSKWGVKPSYHLNKHIMCEEKNIRLITIFEDEWRDKQDIVKRTLSHFLGCSPKGTYARKSIVKEIPWSIAAEFLNKYHLLGAGQPGNYRIGAYDGDELIAVMVFGSPSDERGRKDVVEMKRFVTNGNNNPGIGSKMFKHAVRENGYTSVIAFVDRRWFTGSFKAISGFVVDSTTAPSKFWTNFVVREHRRFKTKKGMLSSGEATDATLTKEQMLEQLGYYPIYDCGKLRLCWRNDN